MSLFDVLLIAHLIGDYLLQTNWMAVNKPKNWLALTLHSGVYTLVIWLASLSYSHSLSWLALLVIFLMHMVLDQRQFVSWWLVNIMRVSRDREAGLSMVVDQTFHLIVLAMSLHI